jgi:hypothetical protein
MVILITVTQPDTTGYYRKDVPKLCKTSFSSRESVPTLFYFGFTVSGFLSRAMKILRDVSKTAE